MTRLEEAILTASLAMLVFSIGYLTLGGQQRQMMLNWEDHKEGLQLFSLIRSSLATNQLLVPRRPAAGMVIEQPIALTTPHAVGQMAARIDTWLLAIDQISVGLDNRFATQTFDNLFESGSQDQPVNPLGNGP